MQGPPKTAQGDRSHSRNANSVINDSPTPRRRIGGGFGNNINQLNENYMVKSLKCLKEKSNENSCMSRTFRGTSNVNS